MRQGNCFPLALPGRKRQWPKSGGQKAAKTLSNGVGSREIVTRGREQRGHTDNSCELCRKEERNCALAVRNDKKLSRAVSRGHPKLQGTWNVGISLTGQGEQAGH